ncbi:MAG: glycosyltransferase family 2 protein [Hyphomonadaceae bacterium]|nr:glycosyltransferase family 2 protein [Hyphomonadaceae bacterium]
MTYPKISALVVSYKTGPRLKECLYALRADPDVAEIILVDNGNPADMRNWLAHFADGHGDIKILDEQGNIGFGAAVNLGAKAAAGPDLLIINPDAVLRQKSLQPMQMVASRQPVPWIIGGKVYDLYGREERGPRRRELTLWRAATSLIGWNTWTLEATTPPAGPVEMPVISGAFFLTDKQSLTALDGFDEGYFLHVEDVDLCQRCWRLGGRVMYQPNAGALHYGATSDAPSAIVAGHKADSLARYFRKFARGPWHRLMIELALPVMRVGLWLKPR